jgi:hypothetical protein
MSRRDERVQARTFVATFKPTRVGGQRSLFEKLGICISLANVATLCTVTIWFGMCEFFYCDSNLTSYPQAC